MQQKNNTQLFFHLTNFVASDFECPCIVIVVDFVHSSLKMKIENKIKCFANIFQFRANDIGLVCTRTRTRLFILEKIRCNVEICSSRKSIQIYYNLSDICNLHAAQMGRTVATVYLKCPK